MYVVNLYVSMIFHHKRNFP